MIKLLFIHLFMISAFLSGAEWNTDYPKSVKEAEEKGKAVLIDFYAAWCGPCRQMAAKTLKDSRVLSELKDFILVKIDIDKNKELAAKYKVSGIPHFIILNRYKEVISETKGYKEPETFVKWVSNNRNLALSAAKVSELSAAEIKLFESFGKDPLKAMETFASIYNYSPPAKKEALLKKLYGINSANFKECLAHKNLQIRLFASSVIASSDKDFKFDPWASVAEREKMLKALKEKK